MLTFYYSLSVSHQIIPTTVPSTHSTSRRLSMRTGRKKSIARTNLLHICERIMDAATLPGMVTMTTATMTMARATSGAVTVCMVRTNQFRFLTGDCPSRRAFLMQLPAYTHTKREKGGDMQKRIVQFFVGLNILRS